MVCVAAEERPPFFLSTAMTLRFSVNSFLFALIIKEIFITFSDFDVFVKISLPKFRRASVDTYKTVLTTTYMLVKQATIFLITI